MRLKKKQKDTIKVFAYLGILLVIIWALATFLPGMVRAVIAPNEPQPLNVCDSNGDCLSNTNCINLTCECVSGYCKMIMPPINGYGCVFGLTPDAHYITQVSCEAAGGVWKVIIF